MDGILKKEKEARNYLKPKFPYNIFQNRNPIKAANIFYELGHLYITERKIKKSIESFQRAAELYKETGESYYIHLSMQSHAKCAELLIEKKNIESTISLERIQNIVIDDEFLVKKSAEFYEQAGRSGEMCESHSVAASYFKRAAELFFKTESEFQRVIFCYEKAAKNYRRASMYLNSKNMSTILFKKCIDNKYYSECLNLEDIGPVEKYLLHKLINKDHALHKFDELYKAVENRSIGEMKKICSELKGVQKTLLNRLIEKFERENDIL